jgi:hypothetical protein
LGRGGETFPAGAERAHRAHAVLEPARDEPDVDRIGEQAAGQRGRPHGPPEAKTGRLARSGVATHRDCHRRRHPAITLFIDSHSGSTVRRSAVR